MDTQSDIFLPSTIYMDLTCPPTVKVQIIGQLLGLIILLITILLFQNYEKSSSNSKNGQQSQTVHAKSGSKLLAINTILILFIFLFVASYIEYEFALGQLSQTGPNRIRGRIETILISHSFSEIILYILLSIISCLVMYKINHYFNKQNRCPCVLNTCFCVFYPFISALKQRKKAKYAHKCIVFVFFISTVISVFIISIKMILFYVARIDSNNFDANEYYTGYKLIDIIQIIFIIIIILPSFISKICFSSILLAILLIVWYSDWVIGFGESIQALSCIIPIVLAIFLSHIQKYKHFAEYYLSVLLDLLYTISVFNVLYYWYSQVIHNEKESYNINYILLQIIIFIICSINCLVFIYQNKRRNVTSDYKSIREMSIICFFYGEFVYIPLCLDRIIYGFKSVVKKKSFKYEYDGLKILKLLFGILPTVMIQTYYLIAQHTHNQTLTNINNPHITQSLIISVLNIIHITFTTFNIDKNLENMAFPNNDHILRIQSPSMKGSVTALAMTRINSNVPTDLDEDVKKLNINITSYHTAQLRVDGKQQTPANEVEYDPLQLTANISVKVTPAVTNNVETPTLQSLQSSVYSLNTNKNKETILDTPLAADITIPPSMTATPNQLKGSVLLTSTLMASGGFLSDDNVINVGSPSSFGFENERRKQLMVDLELESEDDTYGPLMKTTMSETATTETATTLTANNSISTPIIKAQKASDLYPMNVSKKTNFVYKKPPLRFSVIDRHKKNENNGNVESSSYLESEATTATTTATTRDAKMQKIYKKTSMSSDVQIGYDIYETYHANINRVKSITMATVVSNGNQLNIHKENDNNKESVDVFDNPEHFGPHSPPSQTTTDLNANNGENDSKNKTEIRKPLEIEYGMKNKNENEYRNCFNYMLYWKRKVFNIVLLLFVLSDFICRCMVLWLILLMVFSGNIVNIIIGLVAIFVIFIYQFFWQFYMIRKSEKFGVDVGVESGTNAAKGHDNDINGVVSEEEEFDDAAMTLTFSRSRKRDSFCLILEDKLFFGVYLSLFSSLFNLIHCLNIIGFIQYHIDFSKWIFEQIIRILLSFILTVILFIIPDINEAISNNQLLNYLVYIYCVNLFINIAMTIRIKKYIVKSIKIKLLWNDIWIKR